jgi:hypothetical protein
MKNYLLFGVLTFIFSKISAQEETINLRITEVPYQPVYAFFRTSFDLGIQQKVDFNHATFKARNQLGFSIGLISCKESDIQFETRIGYRQVDLSNIDSVPANKHYDLDIMLGGRYYPRYPTFALSKNTPVRLTFSGIGGLCLRGNDLTNMGLTVALSAGFVFSQKDNPSGIMLEAQYRPLGSNAIAGVYLHPAWLLSIAWLFGP